MLIDRLRARLRDPNAASFQLAGEDLALLDLDDLRAAVAAHDLAIPRGLGDALLAEERALADETHRWLQRNRNVHARVAGYVELGRRCDFRYPWPVVAILGIQQVITGMQRNRVIGLVGRVRAKFAKLADASEDVLRRTNRGIYADSVPTVLRALRVAELRASDRSDARAIADALADGVAAPFWDGESRTLCRAIADGLAIADADARFAALAATTLQHFRREQAIFTFHMGVSKRAIPVRSVPAPVVERGKLVVRPYALPAGFDMRDHEARVREFGTAFVRSITGSRADYDVATRWVLRGS
jgi:hypothetical protein